MAQGEWDALLTLAGKIGTISFPTLLVIIIYFSWKGTWVWGKDKNLLEARLTAEILKIENDRDWWRNIALRATGVLETQGQVLRVKESKELVKIDELNKRLLGDDR